MPPPAAATTAFTTTTTISAAAPQARSNEFLTAGLGQIQAQTNLAEAQRLAISFISSNALADLYEANERARRRLDSVLPDPAPKPVSRTSRQWVNPNVLAGMKKKVDSVAKDVREVRGEVANTERRYIEQQDAHVRLVQESAEQVNQRTDQLAATTQQLGESHAAHVARTEQINSQLTSQINQVSSELHGVIDLEGVRNIIYAARDQWIGHWTTGIDQLATSIGELENQRVGPGERFQAVSRGISRASIHSLRERAATVRRNARQFYASQLEVVANMDRVPTEAEVARLMIALTSYGPQREEELAALERQNATIRDGLIQFAQNDPTMLLPEEWMIMPADNIQLQHLLTGPPVQYRTVGRTFQWQIIPVPPQTETETEVSWFASLVPEDRRLANVVFNEDEDGDVPVTDANQPD